jgi:YhcH/YjgK/YiaL family protein
MIYGKLEDLRRYTYVVPHLEHVVNYLENNDLENLEPGKYVVSEHVKLIRENYVARDIEKCYFENHEQALDVQIVLKGKEGFGYIHKSSKEYTETHPYNKEKDVTKYDATPKTVLTLESNDFAIVYNEDLHMPKIKMNEEEVIKAVFKIYL